MNAALDVFADVQISTPAGEARLTGRGDLLVIDCSTLGVARSLFRHPATRSRRARSRTLFLLASGLRRSRLTLSLRVASREIGRLAGSRRGSLLGRLLGLGPLQIRPLALARAARVRP